MNFEARTKRAEQRLAPALKRYGATVVGFTAAGTVLVGTFRCRCGATFYRRVHRVASFQNTALCEQCTKPMRRAQPNPNSMRSRARALGIHQTTLLRRLLAEAKA